MLILFSILVGVLVIGITFMLVTVFDKAPFIGFLLIVAMFLYVLLLQKLKE